MRHGARPDTFLTLTRSCTLSQSQTVCFTVPILTYSVTHMEAVLLTSPQSLTTIQSKASDWDVVEESTVFPAIDMTIH